MVSTVLLLGCVAASPATAQEMQPRAYLPAPVGLNFFGATYSRNSGGLLFDPSLPVEDAHVDANVGALSFGQTLGVFGRTAQVLAVVPYVQADLTGIVGGAEQYRYRSGLGDTAFRYAMNLYGAPAMRLPEFAKYRQKTVVGASVTVAAPTGQYDPNVLVNLGTNRWAFKPELGISRALGNWVIEGAAGVWLYAANNHYQKGSILTQAPLGSLQVDVWRLLPRRSWVAFDGCYFTGGRSSVNGMDRADYKGNSRLGLTFGWAFSRRQALKISYFYGAITRVGSDIGSLGIAYNVIWMKGR